MELDQLLMSCTKGFDNEPSDLFIYCIRPQRRASRQLLCWRLFGMEEWVWGYMHEGVITYDKPMTTEAVHWILLHFGLDYFPDKFLFESVKGMAPYQLMRHRRKYEKKRNWLILNVLSDNPHCKIAPQYVK